MPKRGLGMDVLTAAQQRIEWTFDTFDKIYLSFSAGKDSGVMMHLVCQEAIKRGRRGGGFFLDWEAQVTATVDHARRMFQPYEQCLDPYWSSLPIKTWNP